MSQYPPDAPLRLDVAVREAFPAGGMTVSGLRREIARGRLKVEIIAGKQFTTLAAIKRMRELCTRSASTALRNQPEPAEHIPTPTERLLKVLQNDLSPPATRTDGIKRPG